MPGFVRRFRDAAPPLSDITSIEGVVIVDQAGPAVETGAGTGSVFLVGEMEDGPFATDAGGIQQVFGSQDYADRFGGFGFTYDGVPSQNPCSRVHQAELWNGNAFLKAWGLRCSRLFMGRVDTSVGQVQIAPLAAITNNTVLPVPLLVGGVLTITTNVGGPASSTAIAATSGIINGVGATFPTGFVGGETIELEVNYGSTPLIRQVVFAATDQALVDIIAKINAVLGFVCASNNGGQLRLTNDRTLGTSSKMRASDVTAPILSSKLGITPATVMGSGNVANLGAVTMAEVATIVNGTGALTSNAVKASVTPQGYLRLSSTTLGSGSINITSTAMAISLGITSLATTVAATAHNGGKIAAGTRVRTAGALEWVTMQSLTVAAGAVGPFAVKVRPALDDGNAAGTALATVTTLVDQPSWAQLGVNNAAALSVALTEAQLDTAYTAVLTASLSAVLPTKEANYLLIARRTDTIVRAGVQNTKDAEAYGLFGRKYASGPQLGTSPTAALAEPGNLNVRYDRLFYAPLGMKVTIPQIAARGVAGGVGFTADGVITVRPDGPLTTVCAALAPEEDPGQATNLIDQFFEVDTFGYAVDINTYKAFKAAGLVAPRVDSQFGTFFQSSVDTDTANQARSEIMRRRMADFIQDSIPSIVMKYCKKLNKQTNRDLCLSDWNTFLAGLLSENSEALQRIAAYSLDDSANAGNTATTMGLGVYFVKSKVKTLSSLKDLVFVTEIGPNVVTTTLEE